MTKRRTHHQDTVFNKGTLWNMTAIFGGLALSAFVYLIGNWYIYGDELKRHDVVLSKLSDTVNTLSTTVAVIGEQEKQVAEALRKINDPRR